MAGRGPAPATARRNPSDVPIRGEWTPAPGTGWQHGDIPPCPVRGAAAAETWDTWFTSWFAANWGPEDLPNLRLVIKLWARADSGKATGAERSEYRQLADGLGITRKGQQDRRWKPPTQRPAQGTAAAADDFDPREAYAQLRAVK